MKTSTAAVIALLIIIGAWVIINRDVSENGSQETNQVPTMNFPAGYTPPADDAVNAVSNNSEIKDGVQYVTITARGGYSPRKTSVKAGVPTKIIMKTDGTYDCSASLVIRSLNYRKMLPNTGETIIDAGTPKTGDTIQGVCAMGMYSFAVEFK